MAQQLIRRAVVLAAGFGSRLRDASELPKPLREIHSVPLLVRVLRSLAEAGIEETAIVLGYQADRIREALGRERLPLEVRYLLNERYDKSNGVSLLAARDYVGEGCVLSMADHLYSPRVVEAVLSPEFAEGASVLAVDYEIERCFDLDDATKVEVEGNRIVAISKSLARYNALDSGVFRIGPALLEALDRVFVAKGDCSLSDGVFALSQRGEFYASDICGAPWIDVDTPEAARHAARLIELLGDRLEPQIPPIAPMRERLQSWEGISLAALHAGAARARRFAALPDAE